MAAVLLVTGHDPLHTYRRLFDAAFHGSAAWTDTVTLATPLIFTGLAAAVAFRMQLFNIGAEGQLYIGAICATGVVIWLGPRPRPRITILAMCVCGAAGAALWALIAGVLKAFARTNEIITTLMLNYVAGLLLTYMIFDSASPWRDVSTIQTRSFPQSVALKPSQFWPTVTVFGVSVSFGFLLAARRGGGAVGALPGDALRLRDERDRRLAEGRPLLGNADAAEDPRGDGALRRGRGARRRQPDRRLLARSRRQSAGPPGRELRLHGHRRRRARPVQPVRRLPRRRARRRAPERRAVPPGRGFPDRPRRRDAGDHPVLHARRARSSSATACASADGRPPPVAAEASRRRATTPSSCRCSTEAVVYGTPILFAALGELLAERSGVLNLGVEGMMLVGAAMGFWAHAAGARADGRRPHPCGADGRLLGAGDGADLRRSSSSRCARARSSRGSR